MTSYLNQLNERERWMVLTAIACIIAYIYYALLYTPLAHSVEENNRLLHEKTETLVWMKTVQSQTQHIKTKQNIDNGQLLTLLATQLKKDPNLQSPYTLQQTSSGDIQLNYEQVPFNVFIEWLAKINEHYYINIKQFNANKTKTAGMTQLTLIVSAL